jgi:tetratricopeptide (TPR) repeat protein
MQHLHRVADALPAFERACALDPNLWSAVINGSRALALLDRRDEALRVLDEALARGLAVPPLSNERGEILLGLGRYEEARSAYERAIEAGPDWTPPYRGLLHLLCEWGRHEDGLRVATEALERLPQDVFFRSELVHCLRGMGQHDEAVRRARAWTAGAAPNGWVLSYAYLLAAARKADAARGLLAGLPDDDGESAYYGAGVLAVLGDADGAVEALERALVHGFRLPRGAADDTDLVQLDDPRIAPLLERLRR